MELKTYFAQDASGNIMPGATVMVYEAATTTLATGLQDESGAPLANPFTADSSAKVAFYAPDGLYDITVVGNGRTVTIRAQFVSVDGASVLRSDLAATGGAALVGFQQVGAGAVATTVQSKLRESVSVKDFGGGAEIGALIQAAINSGAKSIEIPDASNWTWETPVVIPELWRGRIFSKQSKSNPIIARTGHNYPMIDAQGALFVEIDGVVATADDSIGTAPACFVVFARMPSGASSGNHRMSNNLIEGAFYYCGIYNVGGEELNFENNYYSLYGSSNTIAYHTAPVVHALNEETYFSGIITKASRTNAVSTSAIRHVGDIVKSYNVGGSCLYVGPNVNDVTFDLTYGGVIGDGYFLALGGYYDNIMLGVDRVECNKSTPIVYAPVDASAGSVSIYKGAYLRSGATNSNKYAVDIAGSTDSRCAIHINTAVKWMSSSTGIEDIYLLRCLKKVQCDVSFLAGAQVETLANSVVTIGALVSSSITMGFSYNLSCGGFFNSNYLHFFADPIVSKAAEVLYGGLKFGNTSGDPLALDYYEEGSFAFTSPDLVGSPSVTATYTRIGNSVTVNIPTLTGTSNANIFACTGLPATITPSTERKTDATVVDNGVASSGRILFSTASVVYVFNNLTDTLSTWTSSGTKALPGNSFTYSM